MRRSGIVFRGLLGVATICLVALTSSQAHAQTEPDPNVTGPAGVAVDAQGVLRVKTFADPGGMLARERLAAARAQLDPKLVAFSKMRKISLNRLEQVLMEKQGVVSDEMKYLAGLQRVRYVFYYPDTKDIVLAGPAEGWASDASGRVVGMRSGRPVLELQDLVVALRAFPAGGKGVDLIGCSIDPTQEGLAAMQSFLRQLGSHATPADTPRVVQGLHDSLGLHDVKVMGVSPKTHFAQVLVEADYRMKLIGIGLERPPVRLASYVERANPSDVGRNAMERWFFTPDYACVRVTGDNLGMELVGDGVKLVGEGEMVTSEGGRVGGRSNKASKAFVMGFTKQYPELAERSPVYAQLRNLVDMAVAAAFIQKQDYYGKAGWSMKFFGNEKSFAVETYPAPKQVDTAVNAVWKGNKLMTPIGGGVEISAEKALEDGNRLTDEGGQVAKTRETLKLELAKGQWWWD